MNTLSAIIRDNLPVDDRSVRLFHGRGKKFPGLEHVSIDLFSTSLLITLYKEISPELLSVLLKAIDLVPSDNILLQKRYLSRPTLEALKGTVPQEEVAKENSLRFHLKFGESQNIGFFLDMYPGRNLLQSISLNKKVLNLFSYTCSLSVAALSGGALEVTNIDMSKSALAVGEANHHLNSFGSKARFLAYDIMNSWKKVFKYGPYDVVVIDPPTNQGDSFKVERDYYKIIKRLVDMTSKDAVVIACLNSPYLSSQFLIDLFLEHAPEFQYEQTYYSAFREMEVNPEEGLKIVMMKRKT